MVKSHLDGEALDGGAEEAADAVGDEVGSVLAGHDAFAEVAVAESGDEVACTSGEVSGPGIISSEMQVARRVEEMRAQEVLAEFGGKSFGDAGQRDAAGVGGNNGTRLADVSALFR